jgi:hypothetical protein
MFAVSSFASTIGNVVLISLRQSIVPGHLLGRVTSVYRLFALGALPSGAIAGGLLARQFGLAAPFWAGGVAFVVMGFAILRVVTPRAIRQARAPV